MQKTKIIRSADSTPENFTSISNQLINDKTLSYEARMLIIRILSLPRDWVIYKEWLEKDSGMGSHKFDRIWKECKDADYIKQTKKRTDKGLYEYTYEVSDVSSTSRLSTPGSSTPGLSTPGSSTPGKPTPIQSNNIQKKEEQKKNEESKEEQTVATSAVKGEKLLGNTDDLSTLISNQNLTAEQKNRKSMKMAEDLFDEYWGKI